VPKKWILLDKRKQWLKLPEPKLSEKIREKLARLMPGYRSGLHRHEWIKHGTCYGKDAEHYFSDALALTEEINQSPVRAFFLKKRGRIVDLPQVRLLFDRVFGKGAGRKVALQCKNGLITELWLDLGGRGSDLGTLLHQGKAMRSRCKRGRVDSAGFGYSRH
jgi:ribonuclease T2